eukprot:1146134-Prorocentrum_minimum.AAC.1
MREATLRRVRQLDQVIPVPDHLHDPQVQHLLLRWCANAGVSHLLRGVVPSATADAAAEHDERVWQGLQRILPGAPLSQRARSVAGLHIRTGGMGLTPAVRVSPAAYLGSWVLAAAPLASACRPLAGILDRADLPAVAEVHQAYTGHIPEVHQ